jgi:GNAT superfamily N-acetyltransferase|tara:strand:- start:157 stop:921 length:765 start_codon:yes stop_codon:yes gene_type:complete
MHIDSANLDNLIKLWKRYGAQTLHKDDNARLCKNISWPNRVWADKPLPLSSESLAQTAKNSPDTSLFPVWPMMSENGSASPQKIVEVLVGQSQDWQAIFQHTAMALSLDKRPQLSTQAAFRYPIEIKRLSGNDDIAAWVATGSKAFGYTIDPNAILPLLVCEDIQILLAYNEDSQPVATGLLFKTGNVAGIHQIGVLDTHRGKGVATQMIRSLIERAEKWQADYAVLQASPAGIPVYRKLGFVDQFLITYLRKS